MPLFDIQTYVVVVKVIILCCGGFLTIVAGRAARRIGVPAMRALAVGFGFVTVGALLAGIAHQLLHVELVVGVAVQSTFTAIGFAVLGYSLYAGNRMDRSVRW